MHFSYLPEADLGLHTLSEEESFHCAKVLRMKAGDPIAVTNGKGKIFQGLLVDGHPKKAVVELTELKETYDQWPFHLHIAIAPTKNIDRLEWFIEKAVEIGVNEISLFTSFHSERKQLRLDRLEKIMLAAMKQSMKSFLPKINALASFDQLLDRTFNGEKFIAYIDDTVVELLGNALQAATECTILIGPEGDFSAKEVAQARAKGFKTVSLGAARLRTETAGIVACHTVQIINQLRKSKAL